MGETKPQNFTLLAGLVGDVASFAALHWGRQAMYRPATQHAAPLRLPPFALADVETMLASSVRSPSIRLVRDGVPIPTASWTRRLRLGGVDLDDVADPTKVADAFAGGASIVLQGLHRTWPPIVEHARDLEDEISHPVQVNAYLTPSACRGLARHSDAHDVFVVQTAGTKQWWVDGIGSLTMRAGDVLYVPAAVEHEAASITSTSLHLTIGVHRRTMRHHVERALQDADELDRPLPLGFAHSEAGSLAHVVRSAIDRSVAHLQDLDQGQLERSITGRRVTPRSSAAGVLQAIAGAGTIDRDSLLVLRPGCSLAAHADGATIDIDGRTLTVPGVAVDAVRRLMVDGRLRVGEMPGLDAESRLVLARRMVRERFVDVAHLAPTGG